MSTRRLHESGRATVDATGRAEVVLQPLRAFETWNVKRMTVACTSTLLVPTARVYRGAVAPSALIDGSFTGTMDSSETDIRLESGERLIAVWEGITVGTAGADVRSTCTFTVEGDAKHGV